ncbi:hypothetical protein BZA05DRAFT_440622 [Tricharina praecox]|uniref:uncharacterized protein n=1 Tax=Tricharina praecox TaxID=43433 RepID=UPI002220B45D|nr:uncharacterized protein BZA05DRAFT_440622 [Tricharina praecox]KAI5859018.1 hypothetical protein BZA05DRAFT_440622 [Tricharina praecox]
MDCRTVAERPESPAFRRFAVNYGAAFSLEGPLEPVASSLGLLTGNLAELDQHEKIFWACDSCGHKFRTLKARELHGRLCDGGYEAKSRAAAPPFQVYLESIQICVVPGRNHDWLIAVAIWILEYGVNEAENYKIDTGRYLLHMVCDVLESPVVPQNVLFCGGNVFDYLGEDYTPADLVYDALRSDCGRLHLFRTSERWYFTDRHHIAYPPVSKEGLNTYGEVWDELFGVFGIRNKEILAHPGGNIFALCATDIWSKNLDNALGRMWNLYQSFLSQEFYQTYPWVKDVLALCWGRVFDRGFSTISDSPKAKHCAGIYGFRFKLELGLAMIFPAMAESGSPDFGIVVATKYDYPEISNYSMPHGFNCSHLKKLLFKKAPVVINTEMKGHLSDGTCLCFLQYIIHNYERLPKMSLSVEEQAGKELEPSPAQFNWLLNNKESVEFQSWPKCAEEPYTATM